MCRYLIQKHKLKSHRYASYQGAIEISPAFIANAIHFSERDKEITPIPFS